MCQKDREIHRANRSSLLESNRTNLVVIYEIADKEPHRHAERRNHHSAMSIDSLSADQCISPHQKDGRAGIQRGVHRREIVDSHPNLSLREDLEGRSTASAWPPN